MAWSTRRKTDGLRLRFTAMARAASHRRPQGLRPPSEGKRVRIGKGKVTVTDGPFSEAKEVIGGFFLVKTATADEALALTREVVDLHLQVLGPEFVLECELRQLDGDAS